MSKTHVFTQTQLDTETGELIPTRWIKKEVKSTEMFIRTYIQDIGALAKCSKAEQSIVLCCLKYLDYNTNKIYLDPQRKEEICETSGIKRNTINSALPRLVKKNILIKDSLNSYTLNPVLFFFGTDVERNNLFNLTIEYKIVE